MNESKKIKKEIIERLENLIDNINCLIDDVNEADFVETLEDVFEDIDRAEDYILEAIDLI